MIRKKLRFVSAVVAASFFLQDLSFAAIEMKPSEISLFPKSIPSIELPKSVATIGDSYHADSRMRGKDKTFILVQDAHTNDSAQMNIARSLESIIKKEKIRFVFLEAADGNNSLALVRDKAPAQKRQLVAREYLRKGVLDGSEYLDITADPSLDFIPWGVEDKNLYWTALKAYEKVAKGREKFKAYLGEVARTIETLKPRIFGISLNEFDQKRTEFLKEKMPLTDYIEVLMSQMKFRNIAVTHYPHLMALSQLKEKEKAINFQKANQEQADAVASLSQEDQATLREAAADSKDTPFKFSAQDNKIQKAFYALLEEKIVTESQGHNVTMSQSHKVTNYPELSKYFEYLKEAERVSPKDILEEQKFLEEEIYASLAKTDDERSLHQADEAQRFLQKLFSLTVTPDEFRAYKKDKESYDIKNVTGFLNRKIMDLQDLYERVTFLKDDYEDYVRSAEEFYRLTYERDMAFLDNSIAMMDKVGDSKAILVTGGYHTPNLMNLLHDKGLSYIVVTPQVLHETNLKKYESLLLSQTEKDIDISPKKMKTTVHSPQSTVAADKIAIFRQLPRQMPVLALLASLTVPNVQLYRDQVDKSLIGNGIIKDSAVPSVVAERFQPSSIADSAAMVRQNNPNKALSDGARLAASAVPLRLAERLNEGPSYWSRVRALFRRAARHIRRSVSTLGQNPAEIWVEEAADHVLYLNIDGKRLRNYQVTKDVLQRWLESKAPKAAIRFDTAGSLTGGGLMIQVSRKLTGDVLGVYDVSNLARLEDLANYLNNILLLNATPEVIAKGNVLYPAQFGRGGDRAGSRLAEVLGGNVAAAVITKLIDDYPVGPDNEDISTVQVSITLKNGEVKKSEFSGRGAGAEEIDVASISEYINATLDLDPNNSQSLYLYGIEKSGQTIRVWIRYEKLGARLAGFEPNAAAAEIVRIAGLVRGLATTHANKASSYKNLAGILETYAKSVSTMSGDATNVEQIQGVLDHQAQDLDRLPGAEELARQLRDVLQARSTTVGEVQPATVGARMANAEIESHLRRMIADAGITLEVLQDPKQLAAAVDKYNARIGGLEDLMVDDKLKSADPIEISEKATKEQEIAYLQTLAQSKLNHVFFSAGRATRLKLPRKFDRLGIIGLTPKIFQALFDLREQLRVEHAQDIAVLDATKVDDYLDGLTKAAADKDTRLDEMIHRAAEGVVEGPEDLSIAQRLIMQYRYELGNLILENPEAGATLEQALSRSNFTLILNESNITAVAKQLSTIGFAGLDNNRVLILEQPEEGGLKVMPDGTTTWYQSQVWPEGHGKPYLDMKLDGTRAFKISTDGRISAANRTVLDIYRELGIETSMFVQTNDLHLLETMTMPERWALAQRAIADGSEMIVELVENKIKQKGGVTVEKPQGGITMRDSHAVKSENLKPYAIPRSISRMFYFIATPAFDKLNSDTFPPYLAVRNADDGSVVLTREFYSGDATSAANNTVAIERPGFELDTIKIQSRFSVALATLSAQSAQPGFTELISRLAGAQPAGFEGRFYLPTMGEYRVPYVHFIDQDGNFALREGFADNETVKTVSADKIRNGDIQISIGRNVGDIVNDVSNGGASLSRRHAQLTLKWNKDHATNEPAVQVFITDLGSKSGTFIDGEDGTLTRIDANVLILLKSAPKAGARMAASQDTSAPVTTTPEITGARLADVVARSNFNKEGLPESITFLDRDKPEAEVAKLNLVDAVDYTVRYSVTIGSMSPNPRNQVMVTLDNEGKILNAQVRIVNGAMSQPLPEEGALKLFFRKQNGKPLGRSNGGLNFGENLIQYKKQLINAILPYANSVFSGSISPDQVTVKTYDLNNGGRKILQVEVNGKVFASYTFRIFTPTGESRNVIQTMWYGEHFPYDMFPVDTQLFVYAALTYEVDDAIGNDRDHTRSTLNPSRLTFFSQEEETEPAARGARMAGEPVTRSHDTGSHGDELLASTTKPELRGVTGARLVGLASMSKIAKSDALDRFVRRVGPTNGAQFALRLNSLRLFTIALVATTLSLIPIGKAEAYSVSVAPTAIETRFMPARVLTAINERGLNNISVQDAVTDAKGATLAAEAIDAPGVTVPTLLTWKLSDIVEFATKDGLVDEGLFNVQLNMILSAMEGANRQNSLLQSQFITDGVSKDVVEKVKALAIQKGILFDVIEFKGIVVQIVKSGTSNVVRLPNGFVQPVNFGAAADSVLDVNGLVIYLAKLAGSVQRSFKTGDNTFNISGIKPDDFSESLIGYIRSKSSDPKAGLTGLDIKEGIFDLNDLALAKITFHLPLIEKLGARLTQIAKAMMQLGSAA